MEEHYEMGENLTPPRSDQKVYTDGHICGTINLTSFPIASLGRIQSTRHYTLSTLEMLEIHYTRAYILQ